MNYPCIVVNGIRENTQIKYIALVQMIHIAINYSANTKIILMENFYLLMSRMNSKCKRNLPSERIQPNK